MLYSQSSQSVYQYTMVKTEIATLIFHKEISILEIILNKDAHMDLKKTKEHYNLIEELTNGQKYLAFVDATHFFRVDEDASVYAALPETIENRIAAAHYTTNLANRLTSNFFRLYFKPNIPFQTFSIKKDAIKWLLLQKENYESFNKH